MNTDATTDAEEYYRSTQHARTHDVFDYSFHSGKTVYDFQIYMYSV